MNLSVFQFEHKVFDSQFVQAASFIGMSFHNLCKSAASVSVTRDEQRKQGQIAVIQRDLGFLLRVSIMSQMLADQ